MIIFAELPAASCYVAPAFAVDEWSVHEPVCFIYVFLPFKYELVVVAPKLPRNVTGMEIPSFATSART